jgi:hypothetical protein
MCHLPRLFDLFKSLSKSSILPNKGSIDLKSEMSYPKSAIGDLKMGDSHTPSTPMSFRWSSFSVIPKCKIVRYRVSSYSFVKCTAKNISYVKKGNLFEETLTESCRWQSFQLSKNGIYFTGSILIFLKKIILNYFPCTLAPQLEHKTPRCCGFYITRNDASQSVELLSTGDQPNGPICFNYCHVKTLPRTPQCHGV